MAKNTVHRAPGEDPLATALQEILQLRARIDRLEAQLATEVRTRRLVVVEEDGFERIVGETDGVEPGLRVQSRSRRGHATAAVMQAFDEDPEYNDEGRGCPEGAQVCLVGGGDSLARLSIYRLKDDDARTWGEGVAFDARLELDQPGGERAVAFDHRGQRVDSSPAYLVRGQRGEGSQAHLIDRVDRLEDMACDLEDRFVTLRAGLRQFTERVEAGLPATP